MLLAQIKKMRCGFNINNDYNLILNLCSASLKKKNFIINGNNYKTNDGTNNKRTIFMLRT